MSFLKGLTKEFKELKASLSGDGDKEKKDEHEGQRAYDPNYGAPSQQPYGYPDQHNQYGGGYPPQPPQPQQGPPGAPPLPPGWVAQFDHNSGRWYYIEQATGISRWEPPAHTAPYGQYPPPQVPQYAGAPGYPAQGQDPYHSQYGGAPPGDYSQGQYYGGEKAHGEKDKSKDDKRNMMLAAGGGLAAGALGGALLANALDDSDDEAKAAAAAGTAPPDSAPPPVGLPPDETADGDSVSQSDRESVLEARQEYERAQLAAQDSDASSSEEEALEEAREEYEEEYEETYDD
ncbi:hypothetical protein BDV18DRAFT_117318 [Aspergillus unguis]